MERRVRQGRRNRYLNSMESPHYNRNMYTFNRNQMFEKQNQMKQLQCYSSEQSCAYTVPYYIIGDPNQNYDRNDYQTYYLNEFQNSQFHNDLNQTTPMMPLIDDYHSSTGGYLASQPTDSDARVSSQASALTLTNIAEAIEDLKGSLHAPKNQLGENESNSSENLGPAKDPEKSACLFGKLDEILNSLKCYIATHPSWENTESPMSTFKKSWSKGKKKFNKPEWVNILAPKYQDRIKRPQTIMKQNNIWEFERLRNLALYFTNLNKNKTKKKKVKKCLKKSCSTTDLPVNAGAYADKAPVCDAGVQVEIEPLKDKRDVAILKDNSTTMNYPLGQYCASFESFDCLSQKAERVMSEPVRTEGGMKSQQDEMKTEEEVSSDTSNIILDYFLDKLRQAKTICEKKSKLPVTITTKTLPRGSSPMNVYTATTGKPQTTVLLQHALGSMKAGEQPPPQHDSESSTSMENLIVTVNKSVSTGDLCFNKVNDTFCEHSRQCYPNSSMKNLKTVENTRQTYSPSNKTNAKVTFRATDLVYGDSDYETVSSLSPSDSFLYVPIDAKHKDIKMGMPQRSYSGNGFSLHRY